MNEIYQDPIIGFLIIKKAFVSPQQDTTHSITYKIIKSDWKGIPDTVDLEEGDEVIGILSAPSDSFYVYGLDVKGEVIELGYEFRGTYHPDWGEMLIRNR